MTIRDPRAPEPALPGPSERPGAAAAPAGEAAPNDFLVRPPAVSLPKGGGAVRGIGEKFRTNPVTGTGSLAVPLPISPGRAGGTPELVLSYDSGAGNGPFGLGWSVDVPRIARKTDRGLPRYEEADASDVFVLSGAEDLVPVEGSDHTDGDWDVRRYRPRVEGLFARIERRTHRVTGETYWQTRSRDNVLSVFGRSASARLADPDDARRVFEWRLETTTHELGHVTRFEYKPEDDAGVDPIATPAERSRARDGHRCANLYLKRVRYGNAEPFADADFRFELVFDYGEHTGDTPDEDAAWAYRLDAFSEFRAGFDVRTRRLCRRVLAFHHIPALSPDPVLVRGLELTHDTTARVALLTAVHVVGYGADGATERLPPLELDYSRPSVDDTVRLLDDASLDNLPDGLDPARMQWVDLDGEGMAGILTEQAGTWFFKRNHGDGTFGPLEIVAERPAVAALAGAQLADVQGDGRLDLVVLRPPTPGFHGRDADGRWQPFRAFEGVPNVDPSDPNVRLVDLDGDGLPDVLITEDEVIRWHRSRGEHGFEPSRAVRKPRREDDGPALVVADGTQSIFLADMTGDGLADLVRVRNGEICYWPNRGWGRFGARVVMARSPVLAAPDAFDPARVRLVDLDGTGPTDLLYLGEHGVVLWFNEAGNGWSDAVRLTALPVPHDAAVVSVVDLRGTGTACLVWSSPLLSDAHRPLRYVDLLAEGKPWLLTRIRNALGAETTLTYAPSTRFYAADRRAGTPWVTRLPFPVHVIETATVHDHVTHSTFVSRYAYHHGHYDGIEREFRGFALVDQWDTGVVSAFEGASDGDLAHPLPPVLTRTWFHTGGWPESPVGAGAWSGDAAAVAVPQPPLPAGLTPAEQRDATRALKGRMLRQEVIADDGGTDVPYAVTEHSWAVRRLQAKGDRAHAVWLTVPDQTVSRRYERIADDPAVCAQIALAVDDYGTVLRSAAVAWPRRAPAEPEQAEPRITVTETDVVHLDTDEAVRIGVPIEQRTWELGGIALGDEASAAGDVRAAWDAGLAEVPPEGELEHAAPEKRLVARRRTRYEGATGALDWGEIAIPVLPHEQYAAAFTPALLGEVHGAGVTDGDLEAAGYVLEEGLWWARSGRVERDAARFRVPVAHVDPFGGRTTIEHDTDALFVVRIVDPAGNEARAEHDYRVLQPKRVTDANGHHQDAAYDALGRLTAMAVVGRDGEGDRLDDPTVSVTVDAWAWVLRGEPVSVRSRARETHGDAGTRWREILEWTDGLGGIALVKTTAEPDEHGPRWVGSGRIVRDNKGNPVKQYEPYFSANDTYEDEPSIRERGRTPVLTYDPLGRVVRADQPNGTFRTVTVDAWSQISADENDNVLASRWYADRIGGALGAAEQRAATLAALHANTPTVTHTDPLGRPFLVQADNGPDGVYRTRSRLDVAGNVLALTDARGIVTQTDRYDLLGRAILTVSPDAGENRILLDVAGQPVVAFRSGDVTIRHERDALRRVVRVRVTEAGAERIVQHVIYGDALAAADATAVHDGNLRGRAVRTYDTAGLTSTAAYDFKGRPLASSRTFLADVDTPVDWGVLAGLDTLAAFDGAGASRLDTESFTGDTTYDALDRPLTSTAPDASVSSFTWNEGGLLESMSVAVRGGAVTGFVDAIDYDAKGRRTRIAYTNDVTTTYEYDPDTFRLTRLRSTRASDGAALQDLRYTYDPVGNVVEITDASQQTLFFANAVADPTTRYEYDAVYRLVGASGREHGSVGQPTDEAAPYATVPHPNDTNAVRPYAERYVYDEVGNFVEMHHAHDGGLDADGRIVAGATLWRRRYRTAADSNRLEATSLPGDPDVTYSAAYAYDVRGSMTQMPHLPAIEPDFRDQARRVALPGAGEALYHYDAGGERARKVVRTGGTTRETLYVGGWERYRESVGGTVTLERETLHVMDDQRRIALVETKTIDERVAIAVPEPVQRYQLANHLGSATVEVDEHGAIISFEEFHPYGTTAWWAGSGHREVSEKRYRYTGNERDDETGLQRHGARWLCCWLGRWCSADPIGLGDGVNRYAYAHDRPIMGSDPSGTKTIQEGGETFLVSGKDVDEEVVVRPKPTFWQAAGAFWSGFKQGVVWGILGALATAAVTGLVAAAAGVSMAAAAPFVLGAMAVVGLAYLAWNAGDIYQGTKRLVTGDGTLEDYEAAGNVVGGVVGGAIAGPAGPAAGEIGGVLGSGARQALRQGARAMVPDELAVTPGGGLLSAADDVADDAVDDAAFAMVGPDITTVIRRRLGWPDIRMDRVRSSKAASEALQQAGRSAPRQPQTMTATTHPGGAVTYQNAQGWKVTYDRYGFPDFSPHKYPLGKAEVRIKLTGSRSADELAANKAAGYTKTPAGYTWHHHQELGLMQLVDADVHGAFAHTGGVSVYQAVFSTTYKH